MSASSASAREVVISGLGVVSPIGIGIEPFWNSLASGKSGVARSEFFPGVASPDCVGGEVKDFTDEAARKIYLKELRKSLKAMCREIQLGVASAMLALKHAELNLDAVDHERLGIEFGANLMLSAPDILSSAAEVCCGENHSNPFAFEDWGPKGLPRMEPLWLLRYLPNMPACHISITTDARGPTNSLTMDDASGNIVIGEAMRILLRGSADMMITGCTGTTLHPIKTLHMALFGDLASTPAEPEKRCRPFDLHRAGRVVGEGACTLLLEDRAHAERRGARIWGKVLGTGATCVSDKTGTPQFRKALASAMTSALQAAGLRPDQIGHVNAHGLGTQAIDIAESQAIHDVFGADLGRKIPVTAPKSYLGNSGAGSGTLELAASVIGLQQGLIPPTLNYDTPDPACPLNVVRGEPLATSNKVVLSVNVTRFGQASATVVEAI